MEKEETQETKKVRVQVVMEYPTQQVSEGQDEEGNSVKLLSLTEAVTEMYSDLKEIKKALV